MEHINAYECLTNLEQYYKEFLDDDTKHVFAVLGKYKTGKRWWLDRVLQERNLNVAKRNGRITPVVLFELLYKHKDGLLLMYDMTSTNFTYKKERDMLLSAARNEKVQYPGKSPEKQGLPAEFEFKGKLFIIDDPYASRSKELEEAIDGLVYEELTVEDLLKYTRENIESICRENNISQDALNKILDFYDYALQQGVIRKEDSFTGAQFNVNGLVLAMRLIEKDKKSAIVAFPQEMALFARKYFT